MSDNDFGWLVDDYLAENPTPINAYSTSLEDYLEPLHPYTILLWCTKKDWCFYKDLEKHTLRNEMFEYIALDDPRYEQILRS